jgi:ribose/xylose/arabinose/galactoside ABC-type transport system permease subunit
MKLSIKSLALTAAILWGGLILLVGSIAQFSNGYGEAFLQMCASFYPGYDPSAGFVGVLIGTAYGLLDGAFCGLVFGAVYNLFAHGGAKG